MNIEFLPARKEEESSQNTRRYEGKNVYLELRGGIDEYFRHQ